MQSNSTRSIHTKSRKGCLRCKRRKVKCDETKPACTRCESRGYQCPGYALNVRWSQKHQAQPDSSRLQNRTLAQTHLRSFSRDLNGSSLEELLFSASVDNDSAMARSYASPVSDENQWSNDEANQTPQWDFPLAETLLTVEGSSNSALTADHMPLLPNNSIWDSTASSGIWGAAGCPPIAEDEDTSIIHGRPSMELNISTSNISCISRPQESYRRSQSPNVLTIAASSHATPSLPRELVHTPTVLSQYFFQEVITLYCTWDSNVNTMRNIIESKWQSFGALHHTIQSMAAACLAKDFPHLASMAATEHSRALTSVRGTLPSAELYEAKLIVYTMLGHTASWLDPHNLATDIFRDTYKAVKEMPSDDSSNSRRFFSGTLDYWAMLLAYLTDCEDLGDYEPGTTPITKPTASERIDPHPYSGLSQETVQIVTEIGILIFQYRKRMSTIKFLLEEHLDTFREALRKARRLERSLLAHRLPELTQVHDTGDPKTPLSHLQAIDEAYRCTGLLQLYRVFPDLLNERYAPWSKEYILRPVPAEKVPTAKERRIWLTELAKHILSILQEIPFESSTRCVQPFIMVALSSELEHESSGHPLDGFGVDQSSVEVSRARNFICSRLAAYWHILPLQKVKVIFELIKCIWAALDSGKKDVYWLDVAYERSLATMMG